MRTTVLLDAGGVLLDETGYENIVCEIIVEILNETLGNYTPTHYWNDVEESISKFCPRTPEEFPDLILESVVGMASQIENYLTTYDILL